jgi:hypothetical protein
MVCTTNIGAKPKRSFSVRRQKGKQAPVWHLQQMQGLLQMATSRKLKSLLFQADPISLGASKA